MNVTHSSRYLTADKNLELRSNHGRLSMCCHATQTTPKAHANASREQVGPSVAANTRRPFRSRSGQRRSPEIGPVILPPPLLLQPVDYTQPSEPSSLNHSQHRPLKAPGKAKSKQVPRIESQEGGRDAKDITSVSVPSESEIQQQDGLTISPEHQESSSSSTDATQTARRKRTRRRVPTIPTQARDQSSGQHSIMPNTNLQQQWQEQWQSQQSHTHDQAETNQIRQQNVHQASTSHAILLPPPTLAPAQTEHVLGMHHVQQPALSDERQQQVEDAVLHESLQGGVAGQPQPFANHSQADMQGLSAPRRPVHNSQQSTQWPQLFPPVPVSDTQVNTFETQQLQQEQDWHYSDLEQVMQQAYEEADIAMAAADLVQATPMPDLRSLRYKMKGLTSDIQDVPDWQTLAGLLHSPRDFDLNAIHVAAAWTRLAHLLAYEHIQNRPSDSSRSASNRRVSARIDQLDGLDLMTVAGAAAATSDRAGQIPARFQSQQYLELLQILEDVARDLASTMTPREASTVLWASAALGHGIAIQTLTVLLQVMLDHYREAKHLDWTLALWGAGKALSALNDSNAYSLKALARHMEFSALHLEHHEHQEAAQQPQITGQDVEGQLAVLKCMAADSQGVSLEGTQIQQALPGVAEDQASSPDLQTTTQHPSLQHLQQQQQQQQQLLEANTQTQSDNHEHVIQDGDSGWLSEAKAVLRLTRLIANHVILRLPRMPQRCLAICLHSLSSLRNGTVMVSHNLRSKVLALVMERSRHMPPRDLVASLNSLANLDVKPPEDWMKKTVVQAGAALKLMAIEEVTLFLHACALMQFRPAPQLLMAVCSHTSKSLATCSTRHICILLWSMAKLRWKPPVEWFDVVMTELLERKHELGGQELALMCYSFAMLHYVPEPGDMQVLLPLIHRVLLEGDELAVATICWALPRLTPNVGGAIRAALLDVTLAGQISYSTHAMAKVLWCVARCSTRPPPFTWLQSCLQWYDSKLVSMNPQEMAMCLWALAKLGYHHGPELFKPHLMARVWSRARPMLPAMGLDGLTTLLHASAWVDYAPGEEYIQDYVDALSLHAASFSPSTLQGVSSVISDMRQKWSAMRKWSKAVKEGKGEEAENMQFQKFRRLGHAKRLADEHWRPVGWVFKTQMQGFDDVGLRIVGN